MMRRLTCALLFTVAIVACCPEAARANPAAVGVAKFLGEYLLSKGLDVVWDAATGVPDVAELQSQLTAYEHALARVDENLSRRISALRRELNQKTTPDQVRAIVRETLRSLEQRIQQAEGRLDTIDARIKAIEDVFGFLPTVTPAPLLRSSVLEGRPEAHPLVVEWITVLCASEVSRRKLIELRHDYRETSSTVKTAVAADQKILAESNAVHQKAKADLAEQLQQRELLLLELKPTHPKVRAFDDSMASLLWLVAVTRPVASGEQKGRLPVPKDMLGPAASDILVAFDLAGADVTVTASLYRRVLADVFAGEESWDVGGSDNESDAAISALFAEAAELSQRLYNLQGRISQTEQSLRRALAQYSEAHETVRALRKQQTGLIDELKTTHEACEAGLAKTMSVYVQSLRTQRPTNRHMVHFRQSLLRPLYVMTSLTSCRDWDLRIEQLDTWKRIAGRRVVSSWDGSDVGQERDDNSLAMKLVWCPAGQFRMGSPARENNRGDDEDQVNVTLSRGFWLGKTEVTQGQWQQLMGTKPWEGKRFVKAGSEYASSYIGWDDAMEFCRKLTRQERSAGRLPSGWEYTLPTEAQWEYACRAGTTTAYSFGDDASRLGEYAWFDENAFDIGEKYAHAVGQKRANAWGLHDMHGNVCELCRDWYAERLAGGTDPVVTAPDSRRVYRGGSCLSVARRCRSADRAGYAPDYRCYDLGFRPVAVQSGSK